MHHVHTHTHHHHSHQCDYHHIMRWQMFVLFNYSLCPLFGGITHQEHHSSSSQTINKYMIIPIFIIITTFHRLHTIANFNTIVLLMMWQMLVLTNPSLQPKYSLCPGNRIHNHYHHHHHYHYKHFKNLTLLNWNIDSLLSWRVELLLSWMIEWDVGLYFPKLATNWAILVRRQVQRKRLIKISKHW